MVFMKISRVSLPHFRLNKKEANTSSQTLSMKRFTLRQGKNKDKSASTQQRVNDEMIVSSNSGTTNSSVKTLAGSGQSTPTPSTGSPVVSGISSTTTLFLPKQGTLCDFAVKTLIGRGSTGRVYVVKDKMTKQKMALKVMPRYNKDAIAIHELMREQSILRTLRGEPLFTQLEASWTDTENFYMLMPLYYTDLDSEVQRCGVIEPARAKFYTAELITGLKHLHSLGIIHRDVKGANVMIDRDGHIVIGDFGLSKNFNRIPTFRERVFQPYYPWSSDEEVADDTPLRDPSELTFVSRNMCGTNIYMAPEMWQGQYYSFSIDFWAAAVLLYIMLTGRPPWYSENEGELVQQIINDPLTFEPTDDVSDDAKSFLSAMLRKEPHERFSVLMMSHPYFEKIDWKDVAERKIPAPWVPAVNGGTGHIVCTKLVSRIYPGDAFNQQNPDPQSEFTYLPQCFMMRLADENHPAFDMTDDEKDSPEHYYFEHEVELIPVWRNFQLLAAGRYPLAHDTASSTDPSNENAARTEDASQPSHVDRAVQTPSESQMKFSTETTSVSNLPERPALVPAVRNAELDNSRRRPKFKLWAQKKLNVALTKYSARKQALA